jgi:dolichyl-phosphate-mannose--protein O-mannosyl transferase
MISVSSLPVNNTIPISFFRIKSSQSRLFKLFFLALTSIWLGSVVYTFYRLSPLAYGVVPLTADEVRDLRWKDTWDLIIHKQ